MDRKRCSEYCRNCKKIVARDGVDSSHTVTRIKSTKTLLRYYDSYKMLLDFNNKNGVLKEIEELEEKFNKIFKMPDIIDFFDKKYRSDAERMLRELEKPVSIRDVNINIYGEVK